jgi:hypothetical protein
MVPNEAAEAADKLRYIVETIIGTNLPHLIVVVEVFSRTRDTTLEGSALNPIRGAGAGCLLLLTRLREAHGDHWCLVPPLRVGALGYQEAVAVFYDSRSLQFTGPNLYYGWDSVTRSGTPLRTDPIGQAQPVAANTVGNIMNYPPEWKACLPDPDPDRTLSFDFGGTTHTIPENQMAGQWEYYRQGTMRPVPSPIQPPYQQDRIYFPDAASRAPFWTQFRDLTIGMNDRLINLFTVHTSPATAAHAVINMQYAAEMNPVAVPDDQVNVILGDFNVDSFGGQQVAYNWLISTVNGFHGLYTMQLDPRAGHTGPVVQTRRPYCMTHLLPNMQTVEINGVNTLRYVATPWNNPPGFTDPRHNVYPRYGYMGGTDIPPITYNDTGALDNVFTAYGHGTQPPHPGTGNPNNITVVNTVVGTPYRALLLLGRSPAGVTAELTSGLTYPTSFQSPTMDAPTDYRVPTPDAAHLPGGVDPPADPNDFTGHHTNGFDLWCNFGKIRSTSDHLPIVVEI